MATDVPTLDGGARGIVMGGNPGVNNIDFFTIPVAGNATDFGNLTQTASLCSSGGNHVRGLCMIGTTSHVNSIEFITISSTGDAQDFGDIGGTNRRNVSATGSRTRMLIAGGVFGSNPYSYKNEIDLVTISQTGNSQDFGDLTLGRTNPFAMSSPTRSVFGAGYHGSSPNGTNILDFVTIASTGDAQDFGDLDEAQNGPGSSSCSSSTRGLTMGGRNISNTTLSRIEYITIATKGNSVKFGDLTQSVRFASGTSDKVRGVRIAGYAVPANADTDTMDYVQIATEGDAVDFGNLTRSTRSTGSSTSNAHGGL
tara:strand:+ start:15 stop:947 length:933 start_codon:yes stop_codon:yes gene_type:complete